MLFRSQSLYSYFKSKHRRKRGMDWQSDEELLLYFKIGFFQKLFGKHINMNLPLFFKKHYLGSITQGLEHWSYKKHYFIFKDLFCEDNFCQLLCFHKTQFLPNLNFPCTTCPFSGPPFSSLLLTSYHRTLPSRDLTLPQPLAWCPYFQF